MSRCFILLRIFSLFLVLLTWNTTGKRSPGYVQNLVLYDFESQAPGHPPEWSVSISPLVSPDTVELKTIFRPGYAPRPGEEGKKKGLALALKASFPPGIKKTTFYIELFPPVKKNLPVTSQSLNLWVFGNGLSYTLEAWISDYRGIFHKIPFTVKPRASGVQHVGWKLLTAVIPKAIPQAVNYEPRLRTLKFEKIVIFIPPEQNLEHFTIFLDELQVVSILRSRKFPGEEISVPWDKLPVAGD